VKKTTVNRRSFLQAATIAGAGSMVASPVAAANYKGVPDNTDMNIAVLQVDSNQPTVEGNIEKMNARIIDAGAKKANIIVLAELQLRSGAYSERETERAIQTIPGPATEAVGEASRNANAYAIFGLIERDGDDRYNALAILGPNGKLVTKYRKCHLFRSENKKYKKGEELCIFRTEFGKIGATICYDIMFPEHFRAIAAKGVGVICHSTAMNTDEPTDTFGWSADMYKALVRVRSFENQSYVASSDCCGTYKTRYYFGNSCIGTPWCEFAGTLGDAEGTLIVRTDFARLKEWQKIAAYWEDRRPEFYKKVLDF